MTTELSIVIVNYKSWKPLENCLNSILKEKKIKFKVVVIDNNSNDSKISEYKSKFKSIIWVESPENFGFSKACNIGASMVKSKWLLFLNPDTKIPNNCLSKLLRRVKNIKNKIVSIKQLDDKKKDTHAYGLFLNFYSLNGIFRYLYRLLFGQSKWRLKNKKSFSPDWVSGSFFLIRRKDYLKLGGWDQDFWMYYEDMDICKRAKDLNMQTLFFNDLFCYHYHGKSSRIDFKTKVDSKSEVIKSSKIYINKHFTGLYGRLLLVTVMLSKIIELSILSLFLKEKRYILKKILK